MAGPKPPNSLHIFTMKPLNSIKLKTLFHTFIFYRMARAFAKAKSLILELFQDAESAILKRNKKQGKLLFGSFRLHYNWCTSRNLMPLSHPNSHVYYDASWNTTTSLDVHDHAPKTDNNNDNNDNDSDELSRYLEWLEEKKKSSDENIDQLADLFIANCHEKFRLEKQESYRRFQEMIYG